MPGLSRDRALCHSVHSDRAHQGHDPPAAGDQVPYPVCRKLDMLNDYDFSDRIRGKFAERYGEGSNVVVLSPDIAKVFPNSESVNAALRKLIELAELTKKVS